MSKSCCEHPKKWSEYKDSNLGPPGPKPGALPDCATLRMKLVAGDGIEPPSGAYETPELPLL